ncbi:inosine monophosphate dehydrogenase [Decorospora gaudefroyi]|uniref:Inosine monophosphate dehydrogenase n=1 Tax=Decorospora gaudefroyi TaxID=184978 RepID=A0A6A5KXD5_9PLEO|nr:inosine monophosphate dehydrogenase [Decorospora gaudefroyi]
MEKEEDRLRQEYPWIQTPLVVGAPMRLIALADMAVEVSKAGGIGFVGAGTDVSTLRSHLQHVQKLLHSSTPLPVSDNTLPIGVGFINWGAGLADSLSIIKEYRPAAVWFFAPSSPASLVAWADNTRQASPATKIWVQVGSVTEAMDTVKQVAPDVLVVQGTDAGGHGLARGAGLISLLPEVCDAVAAHFQPANNRERKPILLAAGGITESRAATAAFILGASGIVLGTRLLATPQAAISHGYRAEILRATDGGQNTVRTTVYDTLRGTQWPASHNARGLINQSFTDAVGGMSEEMNKKLYEEEMGKGDVGWGFQGRMTTYAGSGVGLVKEVKGAREVVGELRDGVRKLLVGLGREERM